jgi:uncharacterized damage-inducible protein DinB
MTHASNLIADYDVEVGFTRTLLQAVPEGRMDWKPHEKSMSLGELTGHLAEMPVWVGSMMEPELDFAAMMSDYKPLVPASREEMAKVFEANLPLVAEHLADKDDAFLEETWTMRKGDQVLMQSPRKDVLRSIIIHHAAHHRGQLTVYLRLMGVPVPPTYGGTADVPMF